MNDFAAHADDDRELLRRYAGRGDQEAFRRLVERYSGLVYGTAMRKTGNPEWAADITQNVFAALALKSNRLVAGAGIPSVGAWLHRAATFESKRHTRDQLNARRRHAMIEEKLVALTNAEPDESWNAVRPILDEALEKLPARDRDILILHFFDRLKFAEIAERQGLRAEAVQKRSTRALGKLARLLRARGIAVSVAALCAGLAPELGRAAPASLVTKIGTTTALAGGGTATLTTLATMTLASKTTLAGIAIAAAVLTVTLGTGYLVGSATRPQAVPPPTFVQGVEAASPESPSIADVSVAPRVAFPPGRIDTAIQRLLEFSLQREKLLNEGNALQKGGAPFEVLRGIVARAEAIDDAAGKAVAALDAGELDESVERIKDLGSEPARDWELGVLIKTWAGKEPERAVAVGKSLGPSPTRAAYRGWGMSDPLGAMAYQRALAGNDHSAGREALAGIFDGWARDDPATAMNALEALDFDDQKTAARSFDAALQSESKRPELLAAVATVKDEALRVQLARDLGERWAKVAPVEAMAWFDTLRFENPRASLRAAMEILEKASEAGLQNEGADWIWPKLPDDMRGRFVSEYVAGEWSRRDKAGAEAWLDANGIETTVTRP